LIIYQFFFRSILAVIITVSHYGTVVEFLVG